MHYLEQGLHWATDFMSLEIGWYEIVVKVNGVETESRETSVYEYYLEEE